MFLRKFLNKKNLVNIFNKFKNYEIYGLTVSNILIYLLLLGEKAGMGERLDLELNTGGSDPLFRNFAPPVIPEFRPTRHSGISL